MNKLLLFAGLLFFVGLMNCFPDREPLNPVEQARPSFLKIIEPADSAFAVPTDENITIEFNEPMDSATMNRAFRLYSIPDRQIYNGTFSASGNTIIFDPTENLANATEFELSLQLRWPKDINGNSITLDTTQFIYKEFVTGGAYGDYRQQNVKNVFFSNGYDGIISKLILSGTDFEVKQMTEPLSEYGYKQMEIAFSPDGGKLYITNGKSTLFVLDPASYSVLSEITRENFKPLELVAGQNSVYVLNDNAKAVTIINASTDAITGEIALGYRPRGLALSNDEQYLFIGGRSDDSLRIYDTGTKALVKAISKGNGMTTARIEIPPAAKTVYAANKNSAIISTLDGAALTLGESIDPGSDGAIQEIKFTEKFGYASLTVGNTGQVIKFDLAANTVVGSVDLENKCQGLAITAYDEILYVGQNSRPPQITVFLAQDLRPVRTYFVPVINVAAALWDMEIMP